MRLLTVEKFYCQGWVRLIPCWGDKTVRRAAPLVRNDGKALAMTWRRAGTHDLEGALV